VCLGLGPSAGPPVHRARWQTLRNEQRALEESLDAVNSRIDSVRVDMKENEEYGIK
jgi:hypothetical protein